MAGLLSFAARNFRRIAVATLWVIAVFLVLIVGFLILGLSATRPDDAAILAGIFFFFLVLTWAIRRARTRTAIAEVLEKQPEVVVLQSHSFATEDHRRHLRTTARVIQRLVVGDVGRATLRGNRLLTWSTPDTQSSETAAGLAVFVSYAHDDQESARFVDTYLRKLGLDTWFDRSEIEPAMPLAEYIPQGIDGCSHFMPLLSRKYTESDWCLRELKLAMGDGTKIVPVRIDAAFRLDQAPAEFRDLYRERLKDPLYVDLASHRADRKLKSLAKRLRKG